MKAEQRQPTFAEAFRFWLKLGLISFGGPTGQIAILHAELVEKRHWIDEERFLHALSCCMMLPGPEATRRFDLPILPWACWHLCETAIHRHRAWLPMVCSGSPAFSFWRVARRRQKIPTTTGRARRFTRRRSSS